MRAISLPNRNDSSPGLRRSGEATVTETGVHEVDMGSLHGEQGSRAGAEVQRDIHKRIATGKDVTKPDASSPSKGAATPKDVTTKEDLDRGKQKTD